MFVILITEIISFFGIYYLRYRNQNLLFNGFEVKTGNIISIVFYIILASLTIINMFRYGSMSNSSLFFILFISLTGLISLTVSAFISLKETKIIPVCIFILANILILSLFIASFSKSEKFRFFKSLMIFLIILVSGVSIVFLKVINFSDDSALYGNQDRKADSGVILGAAVWGGNRPSPVLKERINKGFEIYQKNYVPKLVITGGGSPNELTEGEVSKNVLLKYGVAPDDLILENSSSSTVEQIQFVRDKLYDKENWKKIILVSDNFHLYRATEICRFNDINSDCISSDKELSPNGTYSFCLKESLALIIFWVSGI